MVADEGFVPGMDLPFGSGSASSIVSRFLSSLFFEKMTKFKDAGVQWCLRTTRSQIYLNVPINFATFIVNVFGEVESFVFLWQPLPLDIFSVPKDTQCSQTYAMKIGFFFSIFVTWFRNANQSCPITSWTLITKVVIIFRYFFCPKRCLSQLVIGHDWSAFLNPVAKMKILSIEKIKRKSNFYCLCLRTLRIFWDRKNSKRKRLNIERQNFQLLLFKFFGIFIGSAWHSLGNTNLFFF